MGGSNQLVGVFVTCGLDLSVIVIALGVNSGNWLTNENMVV